MNESDNNCQIYNNLECVKVISEDFGCPKYTPLDDQVIVDRLTFFKVIEPIRKNIKTISNAYGTQYRNLSDEVIGGYYHKTNNYYLSKKYLPEPELYSAIADYSGTYSNLIKKMRETEMSIEPVDHCIMLVDLVNYIKVQPKLKVLAEIEFILENIRQDEGISRQETLQTSIDILAKTYPQIKFTNHSITEEN